MASSGEMTPPWGVPVTDAERTPSTSTPARSHWRMSLSTRRSETRLPTSDRSLSWSISPKKFEMSASKTKCRPRGKDIRMTSRASVAERLGRNPKLVGRKSASKMGSRTILAAAWHTRSRTVGMPRGRIRPSGFGISTRRSGDGW